MFGPKAGFIALGCVMLLLLLIYTAYFGKEVLVKYFGNTEEALVVIPPYDCRSTKYSKPRITVDVNDEAYILNISSGECRSGKYGRGVIFKVKKHPYFNSIVMPDSYPEIPLLPVALPFLLMLFMRDKKGPEHPIP